MQLIEKYRWALIVVIVVILGLLLFNGNQDKSTTKKDDTKATTKTEATKKAEAKKKAAADKKATAEAAKTGEVTYTAQAGDSYTVLARKAIQAFASDSSTKVTKAQIVAAETFLTQDAGSPYLNFGQKVTLDKAVVAKAVAKAQALPAANLALWETYVPYVNFDTSHNG